MLLNIPERRQMRQAAVFLDGSHAKNGKSPTKFVTEASKNISLFYAPALLNFRLINIAACLRVLEKV